MTRGRPGLRLIVQGGCDNSVLSLGLARAQIVALRPAYSMLNTASRDVVPGGRRGPRRERACWVVVVGSESIGQVGAARALESGPAVGEKVRPGPRSSLMWSRTSVNGQDCGIVHRLRRSLFGSGLRG